MAIRGDVTIDWSSSPRIVEIAYPSTEITMQDLLDTLRYLESQPTAMDNKPIVDASGKEVLDSITRVGITVTLQNARASFEARTGPTWEVCEFVGGNLVAVGSDGSTAIQPVHATAFVTPSRAASSSATLSYSETTEPVDNEAIAQAVLDAGAATKQDVVNAAML